MLFQVTYALNKDEVNVVFVQAEEEESFQDVVTEALGLIDIAHGDGATDLLQGFSVLRKEGTTNDAQA